MNLLGNHLQIGIVITSTDVSEQPEMNDLHPQGVANHSNRINGNFSDAINVQIEMPLVYNTVLYLSEPLRTMRRSTSHQLKIG